MDGADRGATTDGTGGTAPLVIALGARLVPRLLLAGGVLVVVGAGLAVGMVGQADDASGSTATSVIGFAIAAVVVLFGLLCLWAAVRGRGARLVVDAVGVRREARTGAWALGWTDLTAVGLVTTVWAPPRSAATFGRGERTGRIAVAVREPPAPAVAEALIRLRRGDVPEPFTHWVTLGTNADWIAAADEALARFAGERYVARSERETLRRRYS